jgi:hypothetical protein
MQIKMKTRINVETLKKALIKNKEEHLKIVKEARVGYIKTAKATLATKLDELSKGKITALYFSALKLPLDHTPDYDTVIGMLQMTEEKEIELTGDEYRMFVEDKWEWSQTFFINNSLYSSTALSKVSSED